MKRIITMFFALIIAGAGYAQTVKTDSVIMGAGYANDFFYSLQNGTVKSISANSWDLGFESYLRGASIIVNHVKGLKLIRVLNQDTSNWTNLDTAGINSWPMYYNSDTSWEFGAFNRGANLTNLFDYGWGVYNINVNNVYGDDSLFVLRSGTTAPYSYKKIRIISKEGLANSYVFRIANLDNTKDSTLTLTESAYSAKNFTYFDISNDSILDFEPANTSWDILFTRYTDLPFNELEPPVTGVLSNKGVQVIEVPNVDINNVDYNNYSSGLTTNINAIGYSWKVFDYQSFSYNVLDSLVYFIKTADNRIYKLWFSQFDGTATGRIVFNLNEVFVTSGVSTINGRQVLANIYPNPSSDNFNLVYSTPETSAAEMNVFDLAGRMVLSKKLNVKGGLNVIPVALNGIANGTYLVKVLQDGSSVNLKTIVSK